MPRTGSTTGRAGRRRPRRGGAGHQRRTAIVMPMFHGRDGARLQPGPGAESRRPPTPAGQLGQRRTPTRFGYNGIKNGMSGVAFVVGSVYANARRAKEATGRPLRQVEPAESWSQALAELEDFNQYMHVPLRATPARWTYWTEAKIAMIPVPGRHVLHLGGRQPNTADAQGSS